MTLNGVILRKLSTIEQVVRELRSLGRLTVAGVDQDWRTRRAVERNLQIAVEAVIDTCQRWIALQNLTPASTGGEAVKRCVEIGMLSDEAPYRRMVQFRNFIVHRYEQVDAAILVDIVNHRLGDLERFVREVRAHVADR